jgi:hypothetical protein
MTYTKRNNYSKLEYFKGVCKPNYHYHPGHSKSNYNGCMKDSDMKMESFISLSGSVRGTINPYWRYNTIPGV